MIFAVKHCESIVHEESAHKEKLTNIIVVEARVACNNVGVMVLAVENESIGRAADFGALLGRIRKCRRLGRRNNSLLRLDVHARRQHTDTKRIRGSVVFDLDLRIAESAEKGLV